MALARPRPCAIMGLVRPSSGNVLLDGEDIAG
jgi:hypothetical protein